MRRAATAVAAAARRIHMDRKRVGKAVVFIYHLDEVGELIHLVKHHGEVKNSIRGPRKMAVAAHVVAENCNGVVESLFMLQCIYV